MKMQMDTDIDKTWKWTWTWNIIIGTDKVTDMEMDHLNGHFSKHN
jgi:hypothetical protein